MATKIIYQPNYKVFTALLTQGNQDDPAFVVLENTIGITPTITRDDVGSYSVLFSGMIESIDKIYANFSFSRNFAHSYIRYGGSGLLYISTADITGEQVDISSIQTPSSKCFLEIRVYNADAPGATTGNPGGGGGTDLKI